MDVKNLELILSSNSKKIKNFKPNGRAKKLNGFLTLLHCVCEHFTKTEDYEEFYEK